MIFMATQGVVRVRLSEILRERNLTQKALADMTGMTHQSINKLANNPRQIGMDTIKLLCDALDMQPGDLIVYEDSEN